MGLDNPLWRQIQKLQLDQDGTMHVPATANGEDGITIGDPPLGVPPATEPDAGGRRGLRARLRSLFR